MSEQDNQAPIVLPEGENGPNGQKGKGANDWDDWYCDNCSKGMSDEDEEYIWNYTAYCCKECAESAQDQMGA